MNDILTYKTSSTIKDWTNEAGDGKTNEESTGMVGSLKIWSVPLQCLWVDADTSHWNPDVYGSMKGSMFSLSLHSCFKWALD